MLQGAYAVFLSQKGTIMIYHVFKGELRGIISPCLKVPTPTAALQRDNTTAIDRIVQATSFGNGVFSAQSLAIDPSGIYLAVAVPETQHSNWAVRLFEIAGADKGRRDRFAGQLRRQGRIRALRWSPDGTRLAVSSLTGIGIWRISSGMHKNIVKAMGHCPGLHLRFVSLR